MVGERENVKPVGSERPRAAGKIYIEFLGVFRDITGTKEFEIDDPGDATLGDIIEILAERFGNHMKSRILDGSGRVDETLGLILSGKVLDPDAALGTRVRGGDKLVLTQAMSGG